MNLVTHVQPVAVELGPYAGEDAGDLARGLLDVLARPVVVRAIGEIRGCEQNSRVGPTRLVALPQQQHRSENYVHKAPAMPEIVTYTLAFFLK